jgi:hypothetical protein
MLERVRVPALPAVARWSLVALVAGLLAWGSLTTGPAPSRVTAHLPYSDEGTRT